MRSRLYSTKMLTPLQCEQLLESLGGLQDSSTSDAHNHDDEEFNEDFNDEYFGLLRRPSNIDIASLPVVLYTRGSVVSDSGEGKRSCIGDTHRGWTCTPNVESDWEDDETDVHMVSPPPCNHDMAGTEM